MKYLSLTLPGGESIQAPGGIPSGGLSKVNEIVRVGVTLLLIAAVIWALVFLIWGGIEWSSSSGDKEKLQKARLRLTYAIVGLLIALLSFFVLNLIGGFFGGTLIQ